MKRGPEVARDAEARDRQAAPRSLRWAGVLVAAGLLLQGLSLGWAHPTAFLLFVLGGGVLVAGGVLSYLWFVLHR